MKTKAKLLLLFSFIGILSYSQNKFDPDSMFIEARKLAFNDQHEKSRELCNVILNRYETYVDARVLMARTFAWDGNYSASIANLSLALVAKPRYYDAIDAMIDVQNWADSVDMALYYCNYGLKYHPNDENFLLRKARLLVSKKSFDEAAELLNQIILLYPSSDKAHLLLKELKINNRKNKISFDQDFEYFNIPWIKRWYLTSLQYSRITPMGTVLGRINTGTFTSSTNSILGDRGYQAEVEAYPRLKHHFYSYLNYGYSPTSYFPKHRVGMELYKNFPHGIEASAGFRYLKYDSEVWIFTGSLAKYIGNYWIAVKPFYTPTTTNGKTMFSQSYQLTLRRYFSSANDYLSFIVSSGSSPDERNNVNGEPLSYSLFTYQAKVKFQKALNNRLLVGGVVGYENEEYSPGNVHNVYYVNLNLITIF